MKKLKHRNLIANKMSLYGIICICLMIGASELSFLILPNSNLNTEEPTSNVYSLREPLGDVNEVLGQESDLDPPEIIDLTLDNDQNNPFDLDQNHISDAFDARLDQALHRQDLKIEGRRDLLTPEIFYSPNNEIIDQEVELDLTSVPIIIMGKTSEFIHFADVFKSYGGIVSHLFQQFLFGFSGTISYSGLERFLEYLDTSEISYFLEEDQQIQSNLYETSRNMRLRPYIWQNWGFNGDANSSIAILDTGLDDSHSMMSGYSDENFNAKIVGWYDATGSPVTEPEDDNGHGSHCATIAAGNSDPVLDTYDRTIATHSWEEDYTGYYTPYELDLNMTVMQFNVTNPGWIDVACQFNDQTPIDYTLMDVYLERNTTTLDSFITTRRDWSFNLSYYVPIEEIGLYQIRAVWKLRDKNDDGNVENMGCSFRATAYWHFNPFPFGEEAIWRGIANNTKLVGVKVLGRDGSGYASDGLEGIQWAITNKEKYHITTLSMSFGISESTYLNYWANQAVKEGLVVVTSAGNTGLSYYESTPASADSVITVGATTLNDQVSSYSSIGKMNPTWDHDGEYVSYCKPDLVAPGGSNDVLSMFAADSNDNDAYGRFEDSVLNDLQGMVGTSMATPAVAGAVSLLIEAMGGYQNWQYSLNQVNLIKSLLLMTATETNLLREDSTDTPTNESTGSPTLDRGKQDIHEGFGRINLDIALETLLYSLMQNDTVTADLTSSSINPMGKHGMGRKVYLVENQPYQFKSNVSEGIDADIYIYSNDSYRFGAPILLGSSISPEMGVNETLGFVAPYTGSYYLVVKAIQGYGSVNISFSRSERELMVDLIPPFDPVWYSENEIQAHILNTGLILETDLMVNFTINNQTLSSQVISSLSPNQTTTLSCLWTPNESIIYRIECKLFFAGEDTSVENNFQKTFIHWDPINRALDNPSLQFTIDPRGKMSITEEDSMVGPKCITTGNVNHTETYGFISTTLYGPGNLIFSYRVVGNDLLYVPGYRTNVENWVTGAYTVAESEVKTVRWGFNYDSYDSSQSWAFIDNIHWTGSPPSPVVSGYPTAVNHSVIEWQKSDQYWETSITNYSIYRESSATYFDNAHTLEPYAVVGPNDFTYIDTNVTATSTWYYTMKAHNEHGESAFSRILRLRPGTPSDPANFSYQNLVEGILFTWDHPIFEGDTPIESYNIYRSKYDTLYSDDIFSSGNWDQIAGLSANETQFLYTEIQNVYPYTYFYYISATNANGTSTQSEIFYFVWKTPPPPVYYLSYSSKTHNSVNLRWYSLWAVSGGYTIIHYSVYRGQNTNLSEALFLADVDFTQYEENHYYLDSNLTLNTTYTYFVTGWNILGEGPPKIRSITTDEHEPEPEPDPEPDPDPDPDPDPTPPPSNNDPPDYSSSRIAGWPIIPLEIIVFISIWYLIEKTQRIRKMSKK